MGVNDDPDVLKRLEQKIRKAAPNCHATLAWSDLLKFEGIPVMETEEVMKLARKAKG